MEFNIFINASKEVVWEILWNKESYHKWTAPFGRGLRLETNWRKGSKVRFLDTDGSGLISMISEIIPTEFISFEHKGIVMNNTEDYASEPAMEWQGALEYYRLRSSECGTELLIDVDITSSRKSYFLSWPIALKKVKQLSEEKENFYESQSLSIMKSCCM
jgi:hypothetical protein